MESMDLKPARKVFSTIGLSLTVVAVVTTVLQLVWFSLPFDWTRQGTGFWLGNFLPLYVCAFPLGLLVMRRAPGEAPEQHELTAKDVLTLIPICFCLMYGGNLIGTALSMALSGGTAENAVANLAMENHSLKVVVMVILAPIIEEFLCRKLIIDRTRRYGEKTAVFLSALAFGLMHQNLFQFFYAFGLGWIFAYIYLRTGHLRYSIVLHALINYMGSVVAPWILTLIDMDVLTAMDPNATAEELLALYGEILPGLLVYLGYAFVLFGLSIAGFVLILTQRKKLLWKEAAQELPKEHRFKTVYLNAGMVIYILLCLIAFVLALL